MKTTKTLMFATLVGLSMGGAAMAQEVTAQFLAPTSIPAPTYQWIPSTSSGYVANPLAPRTSVLGAPLTTLFGASRRTSNAQIFDGSDGGGH